MTKSSIHAVHGCSVFLPAALGLLLMACSEDSDQAEKPDASAESAQRDSGAADASQQGSVSGFCSAYETRCGFGRDNTFADREDCEDDFADKFNQARKQCAADHLEKAAADPDTHCEAAKGDAVCRTP